MDISAWKVFVSGGPMMWPILLCSIVAMTIIVGKVLFFFSVRQDPLALKLKVFGAVKSNEIKGALAVCDASGSPLGRIFRAGLLKIGRSREEISASMEEAARFESFHLEQGLSLLSMIGSVSPLLGLLGTIMGLGSAFHVIQIRSEAMNPAMVADMASGLWQALIVSGAGLVVAIPVFIAVGCFSDHVRRTLLEMERASADLVNFLMNISDASVPDGEQI